MGWGRTECKEKCDISLEMLYISVHFKVKAHLYILPEKLSGLNTGVLVQLNLPSCFTHFDPFSPTDAPDKSNP